jgi:adenylate cyclase
LLLNIKALLRKIGLCKLLFGEILVKEKVITEDELQKALKSQKEKQQLTGHIIRLGQIIEDAGFAKEESVISAINRHYGISANTLSDNIEECVRVKSTSSWKSLRAGKIPISVQLSIAITFVVLMTIVIIAWVFLSREKGQLYQATVQNGKISLNYFVNNAREPLLNDDILKLNVLINEASSVEGLLYAFITDRQMIIKAHTDHKMIGKAMPGFGKVKDITTDNGVTYFNYILPSGADALNVSRQVTFKKKELGTVHVGISLDFISKQIRKETLFIGGLSLIIIVLGISVAVILGIGFSRPISELVSATREIGKGNFQHKITMIRKDEFGDLATSFNYMSRELAMKSWMQETFGRYVSPEILQMIMVHPEESWLKGIRSEASILFTDIRGFTAFSETREPEKIVDALNEYFSIATQSILHYGGYVDKFIGDAVLGVFGVPVKCSDHAEKAVRAAFNMQKEFQEKGKNGNELLSRIGIGINSGVVVSGNIGSQVKMEYTIIGDSVNVASRVNGLAGPGMIILSQSTYLRTKDIVSVEPLPPQMVKGKTEPIEIFSLKGLKEE